MRGVTLCPFTLVGIRPKWSERAWPKAARASEEEAVRARVEGDLLGHHFAITAIHIAPVTHAMYTFL